MSETPTPEARIEQIRQEVKQAHAELQTCIDRQWHNERPALQMSIPARPEHDSDLLIGRGLRAADELLGLVASKDRDLAALRQEHERLQSKAVAWDEIQERGDDAHAYAQQYLIPRSLGRNVWHAILDDAFSQRRQQPVIELPDKHPLRIRAEKSESALAELRQEHEYWSKLSKLLGNGGMDDPAFIYGQITALVRSKQEHAGHFCECGKQVSPKSNLIDSKKP